MRRTTFALAFAAAAIAACGNVRPATDAAPPNIDAQDIDTPIDVPDVPPVDAMDIDTPPPLPGQDFTGAAGRVGGPTFTMDVQLGHPHGQQQVQGATYSVEANTPIKP